MPALHSLARTLVLTGALLAPAAVASATTPEHFVLRTGADYVELCSTPPDDPLYTAAIHFCHGFGVGVYQTMMALTNNDKLTPIMCPSNPPPTRNEGLQRFLAWAKQHPDYLHDPPADVLGRFLVEQFPCPKAPAKKPVGKKS
jgi:hypothetical protein